MSVVLVNPPFTKYEGIKGHGGKAPPLNLGYLAAVLRNEGFKVRILDAEALELSYEDVVKRVKRLNPLIVGFTMPTPTLCHVLNIVSKMKSELPDVPVVVGGPHPSALPRETANLPGIDYVVFGEGELTMLELTEALLMGSRDLRDIHGLAYRHGGEVKVNEKRKLIENLDEIPFPARDLMPHDLYSPPPSKRISTRKSTSMLTSRGCPFSCIYCMSRVIWGKRCRVRSPTNVVDEIEEVVNKFKVGELNFHDDTFTLYKKRVMEICNLIVERGLDVVWNCMSRVDTVSLDMLKLMYKAGCRRISFGVESGAQEILNTLKKGTTVDQAKRAVKLCKEVGIKVSCTFMLGNPGETINTIAATLKLAKELEPDIASFFITTPYPGTELYEIALKRGYIKNEVDWSRFAPLSDKLPVMYIENFSPDDLRKLLKVAYRSFYLRSSYLLKKLRELKEGEGKVKVFMEGLSLLLRILRAGEGD